MLGAGGALYGAWVRWGVGVKHWVLTCAPPTLPAPLAVPAPLLVASPRPAPPHPTLQHLLGVLGEYKAAAAVAAAGGAVVPVGLARKLDGALLAIGTLHDVLKVRRVGV